MLLESFCLHLRNLIEFFFTKAGDEKADDVIATDFYPSGMKGSAYSGPGGTRQQGSDPPHPATQERVRFHQAVGYSCVVQGNYSGRQPICRLRRWREAKPRRWQVVDRASQTAHSPNSNGRSSDAKQHHHYHDRDATSNHDQRTLSQPFPARDHCPEWCPKTYELGNIASPCLLECDGKVVGIALRRVELENC